MYNVIFRKIRNNHSRLRDGVIEGVTHELPELEKSFVFLGDGKLFGTRVVNTSPVKNIEIIGNKYQLFTESGSLYEVEVVGEFDEKSR